jgi:hypothetical protein
MSIRHGEKRKDDHRDREHKPQFIQKIKWRFMKKPGRTRSGFLVLQAKESNKGGFVPFILPETRLQGEIRAVCDS